MNRSLVFSVSRRLAISLFALALLAGCAAQQHVDDTYKFVVLGDSQFHSEPTFEREVKEVELLKPDLVLHVGDMISGYIYSPANLRRMWKKFKRQIAPLTMPFYPTPGNHDISVVEAEPVYAEVWGHKPFYYSFDHKNSHFIVLNAVNPRKEYFLSDAEVAWLKKDLEAHRNAQDIFVSLHPPLYRNNPKDVKAGKAFDWGPIHQLLRKYPVRAVFTGHAHIYDYQVRDGIQYFCLNSSGDMIYYNHLMGWSHHFLVATVNGPKVSFAVVEKHRIYPPNAVSPKERARAQKYLAPDKTLIIPNPAKGPVDATLTVPVHNRANATRDYTVHWVTHDYRWDFTPWGENFTLGPGDKKTLKFTVHGPEGNILRKDLPLLKIDSPYTTLTGWKTTATNTWRLFAPPETEAARLKGKIDLDGQLKESEWKSVPSISRMEINTDGTPAPEKTTVKVLYDNKDLYVGIVGEEPNPAGLSAYAHGDLPLVFGDDDFELYFDPNHTLHTAYRLMVNPKGTKFDSGPNGLFTVTYDVATHVGDRDWSAEFRIPYSTLHTSEPSAGAVWGFNVRRNRQQADPAQRDWSKMRTFPPDPSHFGLLKFE